MRFYRDIISQAAHIARRHKFLWWFGLFTLFLGGKSVEFELFFSDARLLGESLSPFSASFWQLQTWASLQENLLGVPGGPWVFFLVALLLFLVLVILVVISQGALIDGTAQLNSGKTYSLSAGVDAGRKHFSGLLGVNVLGKVLQYLIIIFIGAIIFFISPSRSAAALTYSVFLFLVATPVAMVLSMLMKYGQIEVMLYGASVGQAWSRAWTTFKGNWLVSVEMAALLFLLYFAVGVVAMLVAAVATLPVLLFLLAGAVFFETYTLMAIYVSVFYLATVVAVIIGGLFFATTNYAAWTLLYLHLKQSKERVRPKAERLVTEGLDSPRKSISTPKKSPGPRRKKSKRSTTNAT